MSKLKNFVFGFILGLGSFSVIAVFYVLLTSMLQQISIGGNTALLSIIMFVAYIGVILTLILRFALSKRESNKAEECTLNEQSE